ncbi:MAG: sigma-70 family RNA polymerase sigma factor [Solirubrobacterales bacterium]
MLRLHGDENLIALIRSGNQGAFDVLFDRYQPRLLAFCRHMLKSTEDAEDVLQEVFVAAYNALLQDERSINARPWLYRIARNRCLNHLRRPVPEGHDTMDHLPMDGGTSTADKALKRQDFRNLVADVHTLPETQRTALLLREINGLSYEEIAQAMETSIPSVKSLLVRARIALAEASQARMLTCEEVQLQLAEVAEGLSKLSGSSRRHVRECEQCKEFRDELRSGSKHLAALAPIGLLGMLKALLAGKLGWGAASSGTAAAGGQAATGTSILAGTSATGTTAAGTATAGTAAAGTAAVSSAAAGVGTATATSGGAIGGLSAIGGAVGAKATAGVATAALLTAGAVEVKKTVVSPEPEAPAASAPAKRGAPAASSTRDAKQPARLDGERPRISIPALLAPPPASKPDPAATDKAPPAGPAPSASKAPTVPAADAKPAPAEHAPAGAPKRTAHGGADGTAAPGPATTAPPAHRAVPGEPGSHEGAPVTAPIAGEPPAKPAPKPALPRTTPQPAVQDGARQPGSSG